MIRKINKKLVLMILFFVVSLNLKAHEITPALINLSTNNTKEFNLVLDINLEAMMAGIGSNHKDTKDSPFSSKYDNFRKLNVNEINNQAMQFAQSLPSQFKFKDSFGKLLEFNCELIKIQITPNSDLNSARETKISYKINLENRVKDITFIWSKNLGDFVFRVSQNKTLLATLWTKAGSFSNIVKFNSIKQEQSALDYIIIGFEHILPLGMDHILFVIGLYLLSQRLGALLWQVTAFTIAHTITLALATLSIFTLPSTIIEPLIAASIAFVAIENLFHHHITKFRVFVVFLFGLIHGMGFAGALNKIGLNENAFITSLISFNIGVELGQLAVILGIYIVFQSWLGKTKYWENYFRIPLSVTIATIGIFWFFERI